MRSETRVNVYIGPEIHGKVTEAAGMLTGNRRRRVSISDIGNWGYRIALELMMRGVDPETFLTEARGRRVPTRLAEPTARLGRAKSRAQGGGGSSGG